MDADSLLAGFAIASLAQLVVGALTDRFAAHLRRNGFRDL